MPVHPAGKAFIAPNVQLIVYRPEVSFVAMEAVYPQPMRLDINAFAIKDGSQMVSH